MRTIISSTEFGIIMDVKATRAIRQAEVSAAKTMIERTQERFEIKPAYLAADTAYGSADTLNWIVNEKKIAPHIPVIDKSKREVGPSREKTSDFDPEWNIYICPANKVLTTTGHIGPDHALRYQASLPDCRACMLKPKCCPNMPSRRIVRDVNEDARDIARALRPRLSSDRAAIASPSRCCLLISNASCGLGGFGCAAHAVRKMSLPSPQSRRTYAGLRSWSLDRHQWPMHVLRSRCHVSVSLIQRYRSAKSAR